MTATISTHVLDTGTGRPAVGVSVVVELPDGTPIAHGTTDADGRIAALVPAGVDAGDYRLVFDTGGWFAAAGTTGFYPEVAVTFTAADGEHYHLPLLLSPFAYSTYRGS